MVVTAILTPLVTAWVARMVGAGADNAVEAPPAGPVAPGVPRA